MDAITKFSHAGKEFEISGDSENYVFKMISDNKNFFELDLLQQIQAINLHPGCIIDVGANIGNRSIYFARHLCRQVIAFEPFDESRRFLNKNIFGNRLDELITIRSCGLSDEPKWAKMKCYPENWGKSRILSEEQAENEDPRMHDVFCTSLDRALPKEQNVALIMIDAEGHELPVLQGAEEVIASYRPVLSIEIETPNALSQIIQFLAPYNYFCLTILGKSNNYIFLNRTYHADSFDLNFAQKIRDFRRRIDVSSNQAVANLQKERFVLEMDRLRQINKTYANLLYDMQKKMSRIEGDRSSQDHVEASYKEEIKQLHSAYSDLFYKSLSEDQRRGKLYPSKLRELSSSRLSAAEKARKAPPPPPRLETAPYLAEDVQVDKTVRIGIAAIPNREKSLQETIASLLPQADEIYVSLNGFDTIPDWSFPNKVCFVLAENVGDLAKFSFLTDDYDGYYFTCDDDIIYPPYYVKSIVYYIQKYGGQIVAGWHGSEILSPFTDYYTASSRRVRTFGSYQATERVVHVLGTGCIGFDTSHIRPAMETFKMPNMADIYFALYGQKHKIPFILVPHDRGEALDASSLNDSQDSISDLSIKKNGQRLDVSVLTNDLVGGHEWVRHTPVPSSESSVSYLPTEAKPPLRVLMIGRVTPHIWQKGGIFASCMMMIRQMEMLGYLVEAVELEGKTSDITEKLSDDYDIGFVYGGDMLARDFFNIQRLIENRTERTFPLMFNLSYNLEEGRTQEIAELAAEMHPQDGLFVFTEAAKTELAEKTGRPVIVIPKTIRDDAVMQGGLGYAERSGIFCGDLSKLADPDLTPQARMWIDAAADAFGRDKITVVSQYKVDKLPDLLEGINILPHQKNILDVVGKCLAYAHFSRFCTFEMLPLEAAYSGTPVLYVDMPQSLNEYLGDSGIRIHSPQDLVVTSRLLQEHEPMWSAYSQRGQLRGAHADWRSRAYDLKRAIEAYLCQPVAT